LPPEIQYALLILVMFATHFQAGVTGFGGSVLALPFVVFLLGDLELSVKLLVIQSWIPTIFILVRSRQHIVWREYARMALFTLIGLPIGMVMLSYLPKSALKAVLGVFMIGVGGRGLRVVLQGLEEAAWSPTAVHNWAMNSLLFLGGIIHGAFGSGGPLVVIYATRALTDKGLFRVTLCMLWMTLNTVLLTHWAPGLLSDSLLWHYTAICTPFTAVSIVMGDFCHHRLNERLFRLLVFAVLLVAGVAFVYSAVRGF